MYMYIYIYIYPFLKKLYRIVVLLSIDDLDKIRKEFPLDKIFENSFNYHPKIEVTIDVSPTKFSYTSLHLNNDIYDFEVYKKKTKVPTH